LHSDHSLQPSSSQTTRLHCLPEGGWRLWSPTACRAAIGPAIGITTESGLGAGGRQASAHTMAELNAPRILVRWSETPSPLVTRRFPLVTRRFPLVTRHHFGVSCSQIRLAVTSLTQRRKCVSDLGARCRLSFELGGHRMQGGAGPRSLFIHRDVNIRCRKSACATRVARATSRTCNTRVSSHKGSPSCRADRAAS
jgi:hypothetical protein